MGFISFGTAIGAGVLLLPISAGLGGLIPLLVILVLAFPMTYLAHRNLCRFVLSSSNPKMILLLLQKVILARAVDFNYTFVFFAILPILLVYSANLTTTLLEFLINQFNFNADLTHAARWWVSF